MQQTLVLDLFLTLVKKKTLLGMTYFERKLSKNVKKMTWFFLPLVPVLNIMNKILKNKIGLYTNHFSGCKTCLEKFLFELSFSWGSFDDLVKNDF